MTKRVQQAITDGYMEQQGQDNLDFNTYFVHCGEANRPFVRLERRRTHYYVEVELSSLERCFTGSMHEQARTLFQSVLPGRPQANTRFAPVSIACDRIPPEQARRIATGLYALAVTAPLRE